mmetsp:Transcript_12917/g.31415  ORF Transcript_12917/g.31415 Transcript_12917/m.31415 type:complete len:849 (-) Transcript_12917:68-2614(-)
MTASAAASAAAPTARRRRRRRRRATVAPSPISKSGASSSSSGTLSSAMRSYPEKIKRIQVGDTFSSSVVVGSARTARDPRKLTGRRTTTTSRMIRSTTNFAAAVVAMMLMVTATVFSININPTLPIGDINILAISDAHSFVGGHPHEIDRNADYGDLLSFHARLKQYIEEQNNLVENDDNDNNAAGGNNNTDTKESSRKSDLWLINNGDWIHGTGLAMDGNATALLPIITAIPWDVMTLGNHEAMYTAVMKDIRDTIDTTIPGHFMSSNILWKDTFTPVGNGGRYSLLKGPQTNHTLLVMGFLYDSASVSDSIRVVPVRNAIEQPWFSRALHETYDAILVMAHMDNDDPLLGVIYDAIRSQVDEKMPLTFITGHSHKRQYTQEWKHKDYYVRKMEPGGLFDTIGFVSMPTVSRAKEQHVATMSQEFGHVFLNTSKKVLTESLGLTLPNDDVTNSAAFRTPEGDALASLIQETQQKLGLDQLVACPGQDYFRNVSVFAQDSLWKLWRDHVVPSQIFTKGQNQVMLVGKRSFRYDLRGSGKHDAMTLDDVVAIAPYMENVMYVGDVPDWMIRRMNNTFNTFSHHNIVPDYVLAGNIDEVATVDSFQLFTHEGDLDRIVTKLEKFNFHEFEIQKTGKRDTLYWLDYVMQAYPCPGQEEGFEITPYFYDPDELDEENTDGSFSNIDEGGVITDPDSSAVVDDDDNVAWTLPPDSGYSGYVPGQGDPHKIPDDKYTNYEPPTDDDDVVVPTSSNGPSKSEIKARIERRKKLQRTILKGIFLTIAGCLLLIPVVCLILQITGRLSDDDDDDDGVFYDRKEMTALRRLRRRHGKKSGEHVPLPLNTRPVGEIEIT